MRRRAILVLFAGLLSLQGGYAVAMIPEWPQRGWVWAQEQTSDLSGVRLFQREVFAPLVPAEVARTLVARLPQFDRLMVLDGQILLSGLDRTHHWLARVEREADGARAMISAMTAEVADAQHGEFDSALYVPGDAMLQFSHAQTVEGRRVTQVLYESTRSRSTVISQIGRALLQTGWRSERAVPGDGAQQWWRIGERVLLRIYEREHGSVLWMQHQRGG